MSQIKVGLVQINNSFANAFYFPYSVGVLESYFKAHSKVADQFEFIENIFSRIPVQEAVDHLKDASIVAFSAYVWNVELSLEIARQIKTLNPGAFIIFGGPQVPDKAEQFLEKNRFVDVAVHGEGEVVFQNILEHFFDREFTEIPSISYLENNQFCTNPPKKRIRELEDIPSPYLNGTFLDLIQKHPDKEWLGLWETNRGCPFSCSYCDWGSATQQRMSVFDIGRLEKEILWFAEHEIEFIFCCDSNFGIFPRDLELTQFVCSVKEKTGYPEALSVQNTKNATDRSYEIQKMLSDCKLNKGVTLALQTVNPETLKVVGRDNISTESFEELQRRFNRDKIETYTDLILALPEETFDSFVTGVDTIIANGQYNRIQFINLSILPNAQMGDPLYQKKYAMEVVKTKIINIHGSLAGSNDEVDEYQDLVVGTRTMPREDWVRLRVFSWIASFLFFDKLFQIPVILVKQQLDISYSQMFNWVLDVDENSYPVIYEIIAFFNREAQGIQNGGLEFCKSEEWLNIYWPHDEYAFIKLLKEEKFEQFYREIATLFKEKILERDGHVPDFLLDAVTLNKNLVKVPFIRESITCDSRFNVWEYYTSVLLTGKGELKEQETTYHIDRTTESWGTWEDWHREVVWYGNKKGAYLYPVQNRDVDNS